MSTAPSVLPPTANLHGYQAEVSLDPESGMPFVLYLACICRCCGWTTSNQSALLCPQCVTHECGHATALSLTRLTPLGFKTVMMSMPMTNVKTGEQLTNVKCGVN
jgi:hypothetical protein